MTTAPFQGQSFQTAAFRRRGKPLMCQIEHTKYNDDGTSEDVTVTLRVDPLLDAVRLGATLGPVGAALTTLGDDKVALDEKVRIIEREQPVIADAIRACLVPPSRVEWDAIKGEVDIAVLSQLVQWITRELSGLDPTQPSESSAGSDGTGSGSTDGAPAEG